MIFFHVYLQNFKLTVEVVTMLEISLIVELAFAAYLEHLYFSTSVALISAIAKFIKGSDNLLLSCDYKNEKCLQ